jgi:hypothetical protein
VGGAAVNVNALVSSSQPQHYACTNDTKVAKKAEMIKATVLEVRVRGAVLGTKVNIAELVPRVAEGIPPALPFIASAVSDSAANPTDGGSYRKTE